MSQTLVKNETGAPKPGFRSMNFHVFSGLKAFRSLHYKDRKYYVVRIPAVFVNGYSSGGLVSITPAVADNKAFLILGLTDSQPIGGD